MSEKSRFWCGVLGPLVIQVGTTRISLKGRRKQKLLAALALQPREHLSALALTTRIWPEERSPVDNALHVLVHRTRRRLAELDPAAASLLRSSTQGYVLDIASDGSDVDNFRWHARRARTAFSDNAGSAADHARRALDLVRGDPGQGLWADPYRWPEVRAIKEEITELRRIELEALLRTGEYLTVIPEVTALAQSEPLSEWIHDLYIKALYLAGRQHEAVDVYTRFRVALASELGLDPSPTISQTYRMVLTHDPMLLRLGGASDHRIDAHHHTADRRPATIGDVRIKVGMEALSKAGEFAAAQGGHNEAVDCYEGLLGLQTEPAERARFLLRLGEARYHASGTGHEELAAAAAFYWSTGALSQAAEALSWLARARWLTPKDSHPIGPQLAQITGLVDPQRPGHAGTAALVNASGLLAVTGDLEAGQSTGTLGLTWARRLASTPLQLRARTNLAMMAVHSGNLEAVKELRTILKTYRSESNWVPSALLVTIADAEERSGSLYAARAYRSMASQAARLRGNKADLPWLTAEKIRELFQVGQWEEAAASARDFLAGPQGEHRMASEVHLVLGRIAFADGDIASARQHAKTSVSLSRRSGRSTLGPALALQVHLAISTASPPPRWRSLLEELLEAIRGKSLTGSFGAQLPLALATAGLRTVDLLAYRPVESAWTDALDAVLDGEPYRACQIYTKIGSPGDARQVTKALNL